MTISIVIPVFRATNTLEVLIDQINQLSFAQFNEIIFVYDCGKEESWKEIKKLCQKYRNIKGIRLTRNYGQHNATICGFEYATGDYIVTMDEDLQHSPYLIQKLIERQIETNSDLVYGVYKEKKHSTFRNITSWMLKKMLKKGIPELYENYSSFRLIRADIAKKTLTMSNSYTFLDGYLAWITTSIASTKIPHSESKAGQSSYTIRKLIEHSINIFVTFSSLPIRLLTLGSLMFFLLSFIYAAFIVVNTIVYDNYAAGFPTIISLMGFGFGFVLLGLGVIGEYIQRINMKTTKRPNYLIREVV